MAKIITTLPEPAWDDSVTHNLEIGESQEQLWVKVLEILGAYAPLFRIELFELQSKFIIKKK